MESEGIERLLEEIRDVQQEHLAEYRTVTRRSLEIQEAAANRADQISRLYERALLVGGVVVAVFILLVLYIVVRYL